MARLYADENVPASLAVALRALGHDVLTACDDGRANKKVRDEDLLTHATELGRTVLTNNRRDFHKLHRKRPGHAGIVTFTNDPDRSALAARINSAIPACGEVNGQLFRVVRPNPSTLAGHEPQPRG